MRFRQSGFFRLSRCPSYTWAHIKYPSSLCVYTRVYKHTHTPHPNIRKNREIYKTKPLSPPLPKHSLPRQKQALTMTKLKQTQLPTTPHTRMQVLRNTCDTRACSREIRQYKKNKMRLHECIHTSTCVRTQTHMHTYTQKYIHTYTHTHTHAPIHAYMHTHTHTHAYAHACTHRNPSNNASTRQAISLTHTRIHIHTYIHTHTCAQPAVSVSQMCTLV